MIRWSQTFIAFLIVLWPPVPAVAAEIERGPLDHQWEELMLQGTYAAYSDGKQMPFSPTGAPESAAGSPGSATLTTRGIAVHDFRGTAMIGLLRGGGWTLDGGLLGEAKLVPVSIIELYGKQVWHFYPGLVDNYAKFREEETYEFFLLKREGPKNQAVVLKKWVIGPEEIKWFVPPDIARIPGQTEEQLRRESETRDVRGHLSYDHETKEALVTITGLTHPFVERVKIEQ